MVFVSFGPLTQSLFWVDGDDAFDGIDYIACLCEEIFGAVGQKPFLEISKVVLVRFGFHEGDLVGVK